MEPDWVANHSIVYVVLRPDVQSIRAPIWKEPRKVDWQACCPHPIEEQHLLDPPPIAACKTDAGTVEDRYQAIWHSFEFQQVAGARQQGFNIHGSQTGRGATRERS